MNLSQRLHKIFYKTPLPPSLYEGDTLNDCDREDAASFKDIMWPDISRNHWQEHLGAYSAFTPCAFRYYLPSIINNFIADKTDNFLPVDWLLNTLDTSYNPEQWDNFLLNRFVGFNNDQYKLIYDWVQEINHIDNLMDPISFERISLTILSLEEYSKDKP